MVSTITDRVAGTVDGVPVSFTGYGIIGLENVAGTASGVITADTVPEIGGYRENMYFSMRPDANNVGAVDVNFGEHGQVNLLSPGGVELEADQLDDALEYLIRFNGTEMRIVSPF